MSWLLVDVADDVVRQALYLLANLASDAVDSRSLLTKRQLYECGGAYRLLPTLDHTDEEIVTYACAALQNLADDAEWAWTIHSEGALKVLEALALAHASSNVQHYAAGAVSNTLQRLSKLGVPTGLDGSGNLGLSQSVMFKVHARMNGVALRQLRERAAVRLISQRWSAKRQAHSHALTPSVPSPALPPVPRPIAMPPRRRAAEPSSAACQLPSPSPQIETPSSAVTVGVSARAGSSSRATVDSISTKPQTKAIDTDSPRERMVGIRDQDWPSPTVTGSAAAVDEPSKAVPSIPPAATSSESGPTVELIGTLPPRVTARPTAAAASSTLPSATAVPSVPTAAGAATEAVPTLCDSAAAAAATDAVPSWDAPAAAEATLNDIAASAAATDAVPSWDASAVAEATLNDIAAPAAATDAMPTWDAPAAAHASVATAAEAIPSDPAAAAVTVETSDTTTAVEVVPSTDPAEAKGDERRSQTTMQSNVSTRWDAKEQPSSQPGMCFTNAGVATPATDEGLSDMALGAEETVVVHAREDEAASTAAGALTVDASVENALDEDAEDAEAEARAEEIRKQRQMVRMEAVSRRRRATGGRARYTVFPR